MRRRIAAGLGCLVTTLAVATPAASAGAGLDVVGRADLGSRGMNAGLAVAGPCAYVGSRDASAPLVVDIGDPAHPVVSGSLGARPGSTPRELRAVGAMRDLFVMYYAIAGGFNGFDVYHWDSDCRRPTRVGTYDMAGIQPHEFYLWQDPSAPARVLLYTTVFGGTGNGIRVVDVSNPASPRLLGQWRVPSTYPGNAESHSISVTDDGRTAYLSLWTGGLVVADVSDFGAGIASPVLRPVTPPGAAVRTPPGNVHSAVALPGSPLVMITDERYPAPYGAGCPSGSAHLVDVSNPASLRVIASLAIPENNPSACAANPTATWTSHNPTLTAHLGLVSWYSGGLEAVDLSDPAHPALLAALRPDGVTPRLRDLQLGTTAALTWSYPVISNGLVYVVDINQGLLVLSYHGPYESEISHTAFAEGDSNVRVGVVAAATPPATTAPVPTPSAPRGPAPASAGQVPRALSTAIAAAVLLGLLGAGLGVLRWRRRSGLG